MNRLPVKPFFWTFTVTALVVVLLAPLARATPEYAKKENKKCEFCHTAMGKPDLNDAGRYYKEHNHSLEGYKPSKPVT